MTDNTLAAPEWCLGCRWPIYDNRRGEWDWYCRQWSPTRIKCSNVKELKTRCPRVERYYYRRGTSAA